MIIYKTTNLITNKIYIGQDSKNNPFYFGSGIKIKNSIKKHGIENFVKEIICECENQKDLNEAEIRWIEKLKSTDPDIGYNIHRGGSHFRPLGGLTRDKISKTLTGRKLSEFTKNKMSESKKGKHWSHNKPFPDKLRRKMSESHKGIIPSGETLKKRSKSLKKAWGKRDKTGLHVGENNPFYGKTHSKKHREKISDTQKNLRWIVNEEGNCKRIKAEELNEFIKIGYQQGRKFKKCSY